MTLENSQIVLIHPIVLYGHVGSVKCLMDARKPASGL